MEKLDQKKAELKKGEAKGPQAKAPKTISLLDPKRAMNAAIAIARIKLSYEEMGAAIHGMISGKMDDSELFKLLEFMPTDEESETLKGFADSGGDVQKLGKAEQFMLEMTKIPSREMRMRCLVYQAQFRLGLTDVVDQMSLIEAACDDVKLSLRLKKLLGIILRLGNELNQGMATAFTLDSLLKLNTAKSFDQKTSILHYLVMLAARNDETLLDFKDDLKHVFPASRLVLSALEVELSALDKGLEESQQLQASDPALQEPGSPFASFVQAVEDQLSDAHRLLESTKSKFVNVLAYFGEDPELSPQEFFTTLHLFTRGFEDARAHVERQAKQKERARRVAERKLIDEEQRRLKKEQRLAAAAAEE